MRAGDELAGRYVLDELLGQGAVGEVWRASDRELGRPVAVKVIRERVADPKLAAGLLREARIAGRLQHPGLTVVHDVGEDKGQPFIVMELLHGRDLEAVLQDRPGGLPADDALSLAIQAADALAEAHAGGVVHRDLKPANLFLQDGGQLKICDFGIAVAAGVAAFPASVSYVVGTPAYMSPEQCDGQQAGEPGDVYSLGCVLYALLTGRPPFTGRPPLAVMAQHRTTVPAGPRALRPDIPAALDQLVTAMLAKDPEARPGGAAQVTAALRALQAVPDRPAGAPGGAGRSSSPARRDVAPRAAGQAGGPPAERAEVSSRQLLATASGSTARLWDPAIGKQIAVMRGHKDQVNAICAVTFSGRQLLATGSDDATVRLWDPATGQQVAILEGDTRKINAMCVITVSGRQLLATGGKDRAVLLWDLATGQQAAILEGPRHEITVMCPVAAGGGRHLLATASGWTARLWDPASGKQVAVMRGHIGWVNTICTVTVGSRQLLATGGYDGTVRLWDPVTGKRADRIRARPGTQDDGVMKLCSVTVGGRPLLAVGLFDGTVYLWDLATGQQTAQTRRDPDWGPSTPGVVSGICPVAVDGRLLLATGHYSNVARLWDPVTGQQTAALLDGRHEARALCTVTVSSPPPKAIPSDDDHAVRRRGPAASQLTTTPGTP